jgi:multiple sugar transport system ATP-binding protein
MTLADRIAVMKGGLIQQLDAPQAIYSRPVNRYVAGFIGSPGMNFIDGTLEPDAFDGKRQATGTCTLGIRPEHVTLAGSGQAIPFTKEVEIEIVEPMGADTLVWTKLGKTNFAFLVDSETRIKTADRVVIGFDPARASLFDEASGDRL